jgi:hypothetical protein
LFSLPIPIQLRCLQNSACPSVLMLQYECTTLVGVLRTEYKMVLKKREEKALLRGTAIDGTIILWRICSERC